MPLGAFIADKQLMWSLTSNPVLGHITTFGGHPVSCAAGLAAMKALQEENMIATVRAKEKLFLSLLKHPHIKAIRSAGLLIAVEFESFEKNKVIIDRCIEDGVLTDWFLFAPQCMRIAPPLNISDEAITAACNIIISAINKT
jgi:acetylornithine/succinyldiaminopimelate/putrescine aminotransferase